MSREYTTKSGLTFAIAEARPKDAEELLSYLERTSGESNFFSFGPGELGLSVEEEAGILEDYRSSNITCFCSPVSPARLPGLCLLRPARGRGCPILVSLRCPCLRSIGTAEWVRP